MTDDHAAPRPDRHPARPTRPGNGFQRSRVALSIVAILTAGALAACSTGALTGSDTSAAVQAASGVWDTSAVHSFSIDADESELTEALTAYADTGAKNWISATITIDGTTFENVGLKLKGNSSLRGIAADSDPATLPWIVRLDKYVDDQDLDGTTEFVIRGNSSETSLNEAVALALLGETDLATESAVSARVSFGDGDEQLRLVIQNPDEEWEAEQFDTAGLLYKADSGGDYSYRGDDPASYTDVFDQETGDDDLTPLIDFLQFINESDDATFAADLDQYLDVDAFAEYLAFQELVGNSDDIDGPGNNSYLRYDDATGLMTVVNWDLNLAFGASPGGGAGGGQGGGGGAFGGDTGGVRPTDGPAGAPTDGQATDGQQTGPGGAGGGGMSGSNILSERFLANADFAALVDAQTTALTTSLVTSGTADDIIDEWVSVLTAQATDLVDADTIAEEADAIRSALD